MRPRRRTATLLVSALVLVVGACGSSSKTSSTTATSTTTSATGVTSTSVALAPGPSSSTSLSSSPSTRLLTTATSVGATTVPVATTAGGGDHDIVVGEADNGRTLALHRGDVVRVVLHSTYWQFGDPSNAAVVAPDGPPAYAGQMGGGCVAGQGCGTATARFRVTGSGRSTVSASRTVCGEAVQCTADQQHWAITIGV